jgi:hypothetical protein
LNISESDASCGMTIEVLGWKFPKLDFIVAIPASYEMFVEIELPVSLTASNVEVIYRYIVYAEGLI